MNDLTEMVNSFCEMLRNENNQSEVNTLLAFLTMVNLNLALSLVRSQIALNLDSPAANLPTKGSLDKGALTSALGGLLQVQGSEDLLSSLAQNPQVLTKLASLLGTKSESGKHKSESKKIPHEEVKTKNILDG